MALPKLAASPAAFHSLVGAHCFMLGQVAWHHRPAVLRSPRTHLQPRHLSATSRRFDQQQASQAQQQTPPSNSPPSSSSSSTTEKQSRSATPEPTTGSQDDANFSLPAGWEDDPQFSHVTQFSDLPHRYFGYNQHIKINEDFKEALRQILWQFKAPIRYAFAYGSGVFGQVGSSGTTSPGIGNMSPHPNPPKAVEDWQKGGAKVIDFIFGVSHTQHWHSLNLAQHPDHYSALRFLPYKSAAISLIQDKLGAGVYFNPYITVNGVMIKYGVVNLDTLATDLHDWSTLYLAGRLQKPVKILRDDPRIRLSNQINLLSALRTALLMLPEHFTERELYERIAGLSYMGDPRMRSLPGLGAAENMSKVSNIVGAQLPGFRQLYVPLIENLPNTRFTDPRTPRDIGWEKEDAIRHTGSNVELDENVLGGKEGLTLTQSLDPHMRGNMVRRLPKAFRKKLYYQYKSKFQIPGSAFDSVIEASESEESGSATFRRVEAGEFEERIAQQEDLGEVVGKCVQGTVAWPATSQTVKSFFTAGVGRAWRYYRDKRKRGKEKPKEVEEGKGEEGKATDEKADPTKEKRE